MLLHIGFTGTQRGMTEPQLRHIETLLEAVGRSHAAGRKFLHHGDCVGADAQAHWLSLRIGYAIHLHPPSNPAKRAWCRGWRHCEVEQPYMVRNQAIVDWCSVLLVTPSGLEENQPRSGTWATVRRARRKGIPIHIIQPSGLVTEERGQRGNTPCPI
jgi:hypothetical protein